MPGAYEAGVKCFAHPGTPVLKYEAIAKYNEIYSEWAPNEKVAMEVAIGASGGQSHDRNETCRNECGPDPLFTCSYTE